MKKSLYRSSLSGHNMVITIINPNNVMQKGDFFGTGIPYMPIIPAYLASYLRTKKEDVQVIDAFGKNPFKKRTENGFIIQGLEINEIIEKINNKTEIVCIYAGHVIEHNIIIQILKQIKTKYKDKKVLIFENSQAVTAYSLKMSYKEFFKNDCDFIVYGEPENRINGLIFKKRNQIIVNKPRSKNIDLDELPIPAWDIFPIENYWKLGYAHVPYKEKYMPILTSRGCPFNCEFCIIPFTNKRKWRSRSPENILLEIKHYINKLGINEFHIEDLNPTLDKKRIKKLCKLIIKSKLEIIFKFASGIKLETINKRDLNLLYKAGCRYISFSPESGSQKVLKLMKKPFDYKHGVNMTKYMSKLGIISQACFVLGFPGEEYEDLKMTKKYALKLVGAGIDELAFFIMTPIPGSKPYESSQIKQNDLSKLTFSPKWRKGYKKLNKFRYKVYLAYFFLKLVYSPIKSFKMPYNILSRNFKTKIEMTLYRLFKTLL